MNKPGLKRVVIARITLQQYQSLLSSQWNGSHWHAYALWIFKRPSTVSIENFVETANIIRKVYEGFTAQVVHDGRLTEKFQMQTGVRQGCLPPSVPYNLRLGNKTDVWSIR